MLAGSGPKKKHMDIIIKWTPPLVDPLDRTELIPAIHNAVFFSIEVKEDHRKFLHILPSSTGPLPKSALSGEGGGTREVDTPLTLM